MSIIVVNYSILNNTKNCLFALNNVMCKKRTSLIVWTTASQAESWSWVRFIYTHELFGKGKQQRKPNMYTPAKQFNDMFEGPNRHWARVGMWEETRNRLDDYDDILVILKQRLIWQTYLFILFKVQLHRL